MKGQFTIRQVCSCCEVSRATVLRMESRGLLQPAFVDPQTGYRYYDTNNITRILHIRMFLNMGMSYDDAALYFRSEGKSQELLCSLEERLSALQRAYDAMALRITDEKHLKSEVIRLPEYVCYQKEFKAAPLNERCRSTYETFREAVEKGYRPLISEHVFIVNKREDLWEDENAASDCDYICCIPLKPDCADEHTVFYPGCAAFSILCYGGFSAIGQANIELGRRFRALGLKPAGYPRGIAIVNGYTDEGFSQENYVSRLVIPIGEMSDEEISRINREL